MGFVCCFWVFWVWCECGGLRLYWLVLRFSADGNIALGVLC